MSRFFSSRYSDLKAYTPGEQPRDTVYLKLNTNESPFDPPEAVLKAIAENTRSLRLYSDPECLALREKIAEIYGVSPSCVMVDNGSDEGLYFSFLAFCDKNCGAAFPDITYGFYPVFARFTGTPYNEIPLKEDFSIDISDYFDLNKTIFIANPNAPTGMALTPSQIEQIVIKNPGNMVVIDEAYVDFGAESVIPLINKYDNLIVIRTFSKSRSLAGARLGFVIGREEVINDLNTIRCSTNPYNVNSMTLSAGMASLENDSCNMANCRIIAKNRENTIKNLESLGFFILPSKANFIFARHSLLSGEALYRELKENHVLVRHFDIPRISDYIRITIGTSDDMKKFEDTCRQILSVHGQDL